MEARKERKVTYERLNDVDASIALVEAIVKLRPQKALYRAANYVLHFTQTEGTGEQIGDVKMQLRITDDKKRVICDTVVSYSMSGSSLRFGLPDGEESHQRVKSALRKLLPAIVFQDYTETRPVVLADV